MELIAEPVAANVTQLLAAWCAGNQAALDELVPLVEDEMRRLAAHYLRGERDHAVLQTTALVNEVWLRLLEWRDVSWQNRAHFFGVAANLMRRALVDEVRQRNLRNRDGSVLRVSLSDVAELNHQKPPDLLALDEALDALAELDARRSRIIELRFFGGLTVDETAEVLGVSPRTVAREWSLAQAWLYRELKRSDSTVS